MIFPVTMGNPQGRSPASLNILRPKSDTPVVARLWVAFTRAYLALGVLVLPRSVAKAGQYGGDGFGVVQAAREDHLIVVVLSLLLRNSTGPRRKGVVW